MGPGTLSEILSRLPVIEDPDLLISGTTMDDAGVYRLSSELAMVQTVDFFTPMVDDPYVFGQVAAANSLSDIYAMGAVPKTAMNIIAFPVNKMEITVLEAILAGGADKLIEAKTLLVGGHTIEDDEPKYGLSVTGFVHPEKVLANRGARPGDVLVLTKPLGVGIITTAIKGGVATTEQQQAVIHSMTQLNRYAQEAMQGISVHGCTDVTGFGLLGHGYEMVADNRVGLEIWSNRVPVHGGALELADMGIVPGGAHRNRCYLGDRIGFGEGVSPAMQDILSDPQTSGGLLLALGERDAEKYLRNLKDAGLEGVVIGTVTDRIPGKVMVL